MNALIAEVDKWYRENSEHLLRNFTKVDYRSNQVDPERGSVGFDLEAPTLVATITVWNKGDVSVLVSKQGVRNPIALDDRVLRSDEDIVSLLSGYVQDIIALK